MKTGKSASLATTQQTLKQWRKDLDLAGTHDAATLAKLPADKQQTFD